MRLLWKNRVGLLCEHTATQDVSRNDGGEYEISASALAIVYW
jgi:hypothetical protein